MKIPNYFKQFLQYAWVYSLFQLLAGAQRSRKRFVTQFIRPVAGMHVLDLGCGPADILDYLPSVKYVGVDDNHFYIEKCKKKYGKKGQFFLNNLGEINTLNLPKFDLILLLGIIHHLDDKTAKTLFSSLGQLLNSGGRILSLDPIITKETNFLAKFFILNDRGIFIRDDIQYKALASKFNIKENIQNQFWLPYTHYIMELQNE